MKMITPAKVMHSWVLLLMGCSFCWGQNTGQPVEVTLCDLYQHPEQYAGKMIKVRGGAVGDLRIDAILHDSPAESCASYMRLIVVFPEQTKPSPGFQLVRDQSYKQLETALHSQRPVHIDATYEGRFDPAFVWRDHKRVRVGSSDVKGYGEKHEYDAQIVLHRVSNIWTMQLPAK